MRLIGDGARILFGGLTITEEDLELYQRRWQGQARKPDIAQSRFSDEEALRALLFESAPVIIEAGGEGALELRADFARFPYRILRRDEADTDEGEMPFAVYSLRLVPLHGRVRRVEVLSSAHYLEVFEGGVAAEFMSLRLEIIHRPTTMDLGKLCPTRSYTAEVRLKN